MERNEILAFVALAFTVGIIVGVILTAGGFL